MSCPKCNSQDLWDDMMWWGCNSCNFMSNSVQNNLRSGDTFNKGTSAEWKANKDDRPDRVFKF